MKVTHAALMLVLSMSCLVEAATSSSGRIVLPDNVVPEHYALTLTPDAGHLTFTGEVAITLQVRQRTRSIELNAVALKFDKVTLSGRDETPQVEFKKTSQTVTLTFPTEIVPGRYVLSIHYSGAVATAEGKDTSSALDALLLSPDTTMSGEATAQETTALIALDYDAGGKTKKRALFTQIANSDARRFVPSWDEPARKATFELTAVVPAEQMAVSNMPVETSKDLGNGTKRVHFRRTPRMSPHLLFFALGDFERVHKTVAGVDVGIVFIRGDEAGAHFTLDIAAQLLPYFNDYFGVPYPLPKLDYVSAPGGSSVFEAIENWGAILHPEQTLLRDPKLATEQDKEDTYTLMAHEMAHMWFGDLVTMAWWDDLWLNEAFASWLKDKVADHFQPDWQIHLENDWPIQKAMQIDASLGTHPVMAPVQDALQATNGFDDITYAKGATVIRMLEAHVGAEAFRAGVRSYMKKYAYHNATADDFWREIDAISPKKKITDIAHDFTLQAGVPMLVLQSVTCEAGKQKLVMTQERFAVDASGNSGAREWAVPYAARSVDGRVLARGVVKGKTPQTLVLDGCDPVIIGAEQTGYYRTVYAADAFAALLANLQKMSPADQIGLFEDAYALALIGKMPMPDMMNVFDKLPADGDPEIWDGAVSYFTLLDRLYDDLPGQARFRAYVAQLLRPFYARLGWEPKPGESRNFAGMREAVLIILGRMGDPEVLAEGRRLFTQFLESPQNFSAQARFSILIVVARNADAQTWEKLRTLARNAATTAEKADLYYYLGLTADPQVALQALQLTLTDEIPLASRADIIPTVARRHASEAINFTVAHWAEVEKLVGPSGAQQFLPNIAAYSSDPKMITVLDAFRSTYVPESAELEFKKGAARIEYNAAARARLSQIDQWLASRH